MSQILKSVLRVFLSATLLVTVLPAFSANMAFMNDTAGQYFTAQDWNLFGANVQHVLNAIPDGKRATWFNPNSGNGGSLIPSQTMRKNGTICRNLKIINQGKQRIDQYVFMYCKYRSGWKIQQ